MHFSLHLSCFKLPGERTQDIIFTTLIKSVSLNNCNEIVDTDIMFRKSRSESQINMKMVSSFDNCNCAQCTEERSGQKDQFNVDDFETKLKLRKALNRLMQKAWMAEFDFENSLPGDSTRKFALKYK
jgi:hypothetical protein